VPGKGGGGIRNPFGSGSLGDGGVKKSPGGSVVEKVRKSRPFQRGTEKRKGPAVTERAKKRNAVAGWSERSLIWRNLDQEKTSLVEIREKRLAVERG